MLSTCSWETHADGSEVGNKYRLLALPGPADGAAWQGGSEADGAGADNVVLYGESRPGLGQLWCWLLLLCHLPWLSGFPLVKGILEKPSPAFLWTLLVLLLQLRSSLFPCRDLSEMGPACLPPHACPSSFCFLSISVKLAVPSLYWHRHCWHELQ